MITNNVVVTSERAKDSPTLVVGGYAVEHTHRDVDADDRFDPFVTIHVAQKPVGGAGATVSVYSSIDPDEADAMGRALIAQAAIARHKCATLIAAKAEAENLEDAEA